MVKFFGDVFINCREKIMINLPQQPSPEAVEMLAKLMLRRAIREAPERFALLANGQSINESVRVGEQLSLALVIHPDK